MLSLEEQVLRVFYEGPCSALDCAAELRRYADADAHEIQRLVDELARHSYLRVHTHGAVQRYALTRNGSERLAVLVE